MIYLIVFLSIVCLLALIGVWLRNTPAKYAEEGEPEPWESTADCAYFKRPGEEWKEVPKRQGKLIKLDEWEQASFHVESD